MWRKSLSRDIDSENPILSCPLVKNDRKNQDRLFMRIEISFPFLFICNMNSRVVKILSGVLIGCIMVDMSCESQMVSIVFMNGSLLILKRKRMKKRKKWIVYGIWVLSVSFLGRGKEVCWWFSIKCEDNWWWDNDRIDPKWRSSVQQSEI